MESKKGGFKIVLDSFHQTSWNFVGISTVVCSSFWGLNKFKIVTVATYYGGYSYKVDHNMAPKPWISIPNIKIYLEITITMVQNGCQIQKSPDLGEIWFPSRLWCCELIFIVGLLWRPFWIQNGHQNTKILRFGRNLVSK